MAQPAQRDATYAELEALPENVVGEIVFGVLHAQPRPRVRHARASFRLATKLGAAFDSDEPDGWVILAEPELHLGPHVVVPDLAGWRRARLPALPIEDAYVELAPDWACEILSPATAKLDRGDKLRIYETFMVRHYWLIDPEARTVEVQALVGSSFRLLEIFEGEASAAIPPFETVPLDLRALWAR